MQQREQTLTARCCAVRGAVGLCPVLLEECSRHALDDVGVVGVEEERSGCGGAG